MFKLTRKHKTSQSTLKDLNSQEEIFEWIGQPLNIASLADDSNNFIAASSSPVTTPSRRATRSNRLTNRPLYRAFRKNNNDAFIFNVGDCVLVNGDAGTHGPTLWIAVILQLFHDEEGDMKAKVNWIYRSDDLLKNRPPYPPPIENEVFLGNATNVIDLFTIEDKVEILSKVEFEKGFPSKSGGLSKTFRGKVFFCSRSCDDKRGTYQDLDWDKVYCKGTGPLISKDGAMAILTLKKDVNKEIVNPKTVTRKQGKEKVNQNLPVKKVDSTSIFDDDGRISSRKKVIPDDNSNESFNCDDDFESEGDIDMDDMNSTDQEETPSRRFRKRKRNREEITFEKKKVVITKKIPKTRIKFARLKTTPLPKRTMPKTLPGTLYHQARSRLHGSAIPDSLPCREDEFSEIANHLEEAIQEGTGACIYISGVPGTGKTATVHEVIRYLQEKVQNDEIDPFEFVEINGMKIPDPMQAYALLWEALYDQKVTASHALTLLEKHFTTPSPRRRAYLVLMDELDLLVTRKQTVMYNFFNWPNLSHSRLIVVAIANTMDLPERMLTNKVSSRLGLTRINFQPYTYKQLQCIVQSRLEGIEAFEQDAIELAARKVGAVSGDARRALDICRRAVEIVENTISLTSASKSTSISNGTPTLVSTRAINQAIREMFSSSSIMFIRSASLHQKLFLSSLVARLKKSGTGETTFGHVSQLHVQHCSMSGIRVPTHEDLVSICAQLGMTRAILVEQNGKVLDSGLRLRLATISEQDVVVALGQDKFFSSLL